MSCCISDIEVSILDGIEDEGGRSSEGGNQVLGTNDVPEELDASRPLLEPFDRGFGNSETRESSTV